MRDRGLLFKSDPVLGQTNMCHRKSGFGVAEVGRRIALNTQHFRDTVIVMTILDVCTGLRRLAASTVISQDMRDVCNEADVLLTTLRDTVRSALPNSVVVEQLEALLADHGGA